MKICCTSGVVYAPALRLQPDGTPTRKLLPLRAKTSTTFVHDLGLVFT